MNQYTFIKLFKRIDLKRKMYRSFAEAGIGREIVIFGRKKGAG